MALLSFCGERVVRCGVWVQGIEGVGVSCSAWSLESITVPILVASALSRCLCLRVYLFALQFPFAVW